MWLTIAHRFRGPTESGNGGYTAGTVAAFLGDGPVTVTLRVPPPLDTPLELSHERGTATLTNGPVVVAEAEHAQRADLVTVPPVARDVAAAASTSYPGLRTHPFPECFVCGTARAPGDGMRLFPGRLDDGRSACVWHVDADLAGRAELVWAALDCPGGWAAPIEGRPMVLGRMTAAVTAAPRAGEGCVVVGQVLRTEGRKTFTATTAYDEGGRLLGRALGTWLTLPGARTGP
jgi:hypothetical protein